MTPREYAAYGHSQYDDDETFAQELAALSDAPFTVDFSTPAEPSTSLHARHGPRGGKKPLRAQQQQLCDLQAEMEQKMNELKKAQEEGERLRQRVKVLEVVLPIRDRQVQLLKQRRQSAPSQRCSDSLLRLQLPPLQITELAPSGSSGSLGARSPPAWHHPVASGSQPDLATASAHDPASAADHFRSNCDEVVVPPHAPAATILSNAEKSLLPFCTLRPSNRPPAHVLRHFVSIWNQWVREAGLLLHAHDARPHDPGPQMKIAQLRDNLLMAFCEARLEHPTLMVDLLYVNLQTGEREEPPPESFWVPVAQALRFTPEQLLGCRAALSLYHERLEKVRAERRGLLEQLANSLSSLQQHAQHNSSSSSSRQGGDSRGASWVVGMGVGISGRLQMQVEDVTAQLDYNVAKEGNALEVVKDFMDSSLFTLVQLVRASVLSYPFIPDAISILNTVVAISACTAADQTDAAAFR